MFDKDAPSSKLVLEQLEDKGLSSSLYKYAYWRTHTEWDAKDLVADAIVCACDPDRKPWDPAKRTFFRHMRFVMDDLAVERARKGYARFEGVGAELDVEEVLVDPRPLADEALEDVSEAERRGRWGDRLRARMEGSDPLAVRVFDACSLGIEGDEARAAHAGCTEKEAHEAYRRLMYQAAKIVEEEAELETQRRNEAQRKAKKRGGA
ncbi:MAG: hypothetical protein ACLP1X_11665 [Polyangiaceae bacterium]